jgi:DNA polymerase-3 subunit delta'
MPFDDIIGHERQVENLRRALEADRLPHAYVFLGPEGIGKKTVAYALSMSLFCAERKFDSCGLCPNCKRIREGNHPDVRLVEPLEEKKEISIKQIRQLERELAFRSFYGRRKIAIIDPADLLNYHSQNSLLKTLEEPPGEALLILIARQIRGLLPTVLSRCLRLWFSPPPVEKVAQALVRLKGIAEDRAGVVAALTRGSMGDALDDDVQELLGSRREWLDRLAALSSGDYGAVFALAEELAADKEKTLLWIRWLEGWCWDVLRNQAAEPASVCNVDMIAHVRKEAMLYSVDDTLFVLAQLQTLGPALQRNYNRRLMLERFLIGLAQRRRRAAQLGTA